MATTAAVAATAATATTAATAATKTPPCPACRAGVVTVSVLYYNEAELLAKTISAWSSVSHNGSHCHNHNHTVTARRRTRQPHLPPPLSGPRRCTAASSS